MSSLTPDAARPLLEVRGARASSVIIHKVPAEKAERFLELQRGITRAAEAFPGYQGTEIYPAADTRHPEWVAILHFDQPEALQHWQESPERATWVEKFHREFGDFQMKKVPGSFGHWFAGLDDDDRLPSHWKMVLTVLLGLYPTVMIMSILVTPYTVDWFGLAVAMLIGNALSVALLEWWGMPALNGVLGPWLRAHGKEGKSVSVVGLLLILGVLGALTLLFRLVTG
jgi:antibiotic biosynthesis monooxygenase (ABM) superfamily enzyme